MSTTATLCFLVHNTKFEKAELKLLDLLNILTDYKLCEIFLNVCVSLRILLTIPATVASAEKSFIKYSEMSFAGYVNKSGFRHTGSRQTVFDKFEFDKRFFC
jgi:hypothetical protein